MGKKTGRFVKLKVTDIEVCSGGSFHVMKKPPFEINQFVRRRVAEERLLKWLVFNGIVDPSTAIITLSLIDLKRFGFTDKVTPKVEIVDGKIKAFILQLEQGEKNASSN